MGVSAPLEGRTVVVTRAEGPDGRLGRALAAAGAGVLRVPTVEIGPPRDVTPWVRAVERLGDYDWVVFTSGRAVDALAGRMDPSAGGAGGSGDGAHALPAGMRVAAVGPATADRCEAVGFPVTVVGDGSGGEALARRLMAEGVGGGATVLFPTSGRGRRELEGMLAEVGATVDRVVAYETWIRSFDPSAVAGLGDADVVTFTSPSAVEGWHSAVGDDPARFLSPSVRYVAIGGTTGAAATERGMEVVEAEEPSFRGVVDAVRGLFARDGGRGTEAEEP